MRLTIFESDMGDCLLLEAATGELMLCDGGMTGSFKDQVRAELGKLRTAAPPREIALVYVSHIDNDHVNGVLQLLEDEAEWRVFDHHQATADPIRPPRAPRPPVIKGILHNSFLDVRSQNDKAIQSLLIASAPALYATALPAYIRAADEMQGIAAGIPEALKVLGLARTDALDIPVNKPPGVAAGARLLFAGQPGDTFALGSMQFTLIGPTKGELTRLRRGWNTWLKANPQKVKDIRAELKKRIDAFSNGTLSGSPYDLGDWNGIPDIKGVTAPNIASLMFMVVENGKTLLLTGDAQQDFILDGLTRTGFLATGSVHLDVLKVQHHGSQHNLDEDFARKVSADNYVFCGNGSHGNPEKEVLDIVFQSRVGGPAVRTLAPQAQNRDFHFWFSTTSQAAPPGLERRAVFAQREAHLNSLQAASGGRLHLHFNTGAFTTLPI
jgi:glyoxylase-like metal-dependent hydrolase (beta-lactamase superfamily II)